MAMHLKVALFISIFVSTSAEAHQKLVPDLARLETSQASALNRSLSVLKENAEIRPGIVFKVGVDRDGKDSSVWLSDVSMRPDGRLVGYDLHPQGGLRVRVEVVFDASDIRAVADLGFGTHTPEKLQVFAPTARDAAIR